MYYNIKGHPYKHEEDDCIYLPTNRHKNTQLEVPFSKGKLQKSLKICHVPYPFPSDCVFSSTINIWSGHDRKHYQGQIHVRRQYRTKYKIFTAYIHMIVKETLANLWKWKKYFFFLLKLACFHINTLKLYSNGSCKGYILRSLIIFVVTFWVCDNNVYVIIMFMHRCKECADRLKRSQPVFAQCSFLFWGGGEGGGK